MGTTPTYGLRYQELGDAPDGSALGENLALDVEAELERVDAAAATAAADVSTLQADVAEIPVAWTGQVTTDASGFATIPHGLGWVPAAAIVGNASTAAMSTRAAWAVDHDATLTATQAQVRGIESDGTVVASTTVDLTVVFFRSAL